MVLPACGVQDRCRQRKSRNARGCIDRGGLRLRQIAGGVSSGTTTQRLALHLPPGYLLPRLACQLKGGRDSANVQPGVGTSSICWGIFVSHPRARSDGTDRKDNPDLFDDVDDRLRPLRSQPSKTSWSCCEGRIACGLLPSGKRSGSRQAAEGA